ncbi:N-terminal nucleophile aminohydrolase [Fomitiporia mediterranea MF3/22]|uniref:N-terminal nucleophile aminohydrolase n=1 Tax=Fomitiporia mediterranea (strain MF3/22) TaxID=694068 RepID=UPI0004408CDE|nr:N-terminal nucleophile aminohydrolase [Fomitiporia mediterranea MF3/22]EJD02887.1 N-terminal nucleophile aminohydrolase [Fomitiporia mediterranea MF3/22]
MSAVNNIDGSWLIAVHGGAGYHSTDTPSERAVKYALRSACSSAIEILKNERGESTSAAERAICVLEDDACLNAGYGSYLTIDGNVECDASIMNGATHEFGSVGAVQGVKNPVSLASAIMQNSTEPQPLGRVLPLTLVGPGAHAFAESSGLQLIDPNSLISEQARREWEKWKTRFESSVTSVQGPNIPECRSRNFTFATTSEAESSHLEDTVGAVACDMSGRMAAGVSSGGLLLKYPGRIGERQQSSVLVSGLIHLPMHLLV